MTIRRTRINFKSNIIRLSLTIFLLFFTVELMAGSLLSSQDNPTETKGGLALEVLIEQRTIDYNHAEVFSKSLMGLN